MAERETDQEIARIQGRLADLEAERASMERRLADLLSAPPLAAPMSTVDAGEATKTSGETGKVTLFLAMPISWKGTLAQYVGRLHRGHEGKSEVIVYDYADMAVPVLARMAARRQAGYRALGYVLR